MLTYTDSMVAWEKLNEAFIRNDVGLISTYRGRALYSYNVTILIFRPEVDPKFDFGRHFNYTIAKWKSLVRNYVNYGELYSLKEEILKEEGKKSMYNIAYQFSNSHKHGKNCLLSMVFSRRDSKGTPYISVFLRASEVTKRLICDLLLFQRIGEYIYGDNLFSLVIHFNQMFNDDTVLLMYNAHKDVHKILKKSEDKDRKKILKERLDYLLTCDPEDIKYKVHKRAFKVLRPELYKYPKTLAKDCKLHFR